MIEDCYTVHILRIVFLLDNPACKITFVQYANALINSCIFWKFNLWHHYLL